MPRRFKDLLTFSKECVEFGEKKLDYDKVYRDQVNYMEEELKLERGKINVAKAGEMQKNRKIVRNEDIDVLLDPVNPDKKPFDTATATVAQENNVSIAITLNRIFQYKSIERVKYFRALEYLGKLLRRKSCNFIITSGARNKLEMRKGRELASIGHIAGFEQEESLNAVSENLEQIEQVRGDEDA